MGVDRAAVGRRGLLGAHAGLLVVSVAPPCILLPRSRRACRVASSQVMQPTIPSPQMIVLWINILMTGKATAKEQELQVGDHFALFSSTSSVSKCTHSLLSLLHSIITPTPRMTRRRRRGGGKQDARRGVQTGGCGVMVCGSRESELLNALNSLI